MPIAQHGAEFPVVPLSESERGEKRTSGYEFLSFLSRRFESKFFMKLTWILAQSLNTQGFTPI